MERFLFLKPKENNSEPTMAKGNKKNRNNMQSMFEQHPDAVLGMDPDGKILYINKSVERVFGYPANQLLNKSRKYLDKGDIEKQRKHFRDALNGQTQNYQATVFHKNGHKMNVDITYLPISNEQMKVEMVYVIVKDISHYVQTKEIVSKLKANLEFTEKAGRVGNWEYDINENRAHWSHQMYEIFGLNEDEFRPTIETILALIHPEDREMYLKKYKKAVSNKSNYSSEYRVVRKDSSICYIQETAEIVLDDNQLPVGYVGMCQDVTELNEYEKKIHFLKYHDQLTEIPNRTLFEHQVRSLIEAGKEPFAVMFIDLDRFRIINESLGQEIGDKLLKEFSLRIRQLLNEQSFVARITGDTFGVVMCDYQDNEFPENLAEQIIDSLNVPFIIDDYELFVTSCIGISTFPNHGATTDELLNSADTALNRAKDNGKNNYHIYSSPQNISTLKQYHFERDMWKSIDNKELVLHFQPRVDSASNKIVSAEALVRWQHPVWGIVSPAEFIPLAEETGFINEIGDWVLQQVCENILKWQKENLDVVPISINLSAQRFLRQDWKTTFTKILEVTGVDPKLIEIEITETTLIKHEHIVEKALQFLKGLGIKIALDDFGTGYSSLSYVKDLSIDTIKIDKSFIDQITKNENVEVIIKSLIYMTKGLHMNIVAEGVESGEQLNFLKQLECDEIQGYIFSKPVPEEKLVTLLKRGVLNQAIQGCTTNFNEKRNYFRVELIFPLQAKMSLISIQGKSVDVGKTDVVIENIGPGGLRFLSTIHLPIRPEATFQLETIIMGEKFTLNGHVVWKEEVKGMFKYGFELQITERERDHLIKIFNDFSLELRKNPLLHDCSFLKEDRYIYLRKKNAISKK